ncbi:hypothetical protein AVEN_36358-1 [Araneus ventricosus]|uniref:Uncharacterized protein n=1 Tax=Araneus ventricosus TaxID=182803 RepID=A0A4Y2GAQ5_ARAVE|nr:hypothetical protein AVEN_36358-1 [Araneus ventricosus]
MSRFTSPYPSCLRRSHFSIYDPESKGSGWISILVGNPHLPARRSNSHRFLPLMTVVRGAHVCPALFIRRFLIRRKIVKCEKLEAECFRGRSLWVPKLIGEKHQKGKFGKCYKHFRSFTNVPGWQAFRH